MPWFTIIVRTKAEALAAVSVAASMAQLIDYGVKLSVKLFTFSQTVCHAEKSIKEIPNDISLTSSILKELGDNLKREDEVKPVSEQAVLVAEQTVKEYLRGFKELDDALISSMARLGLLEGEGKKKSRGIAVPEKLKWPLKQLKMGPPRDNLSWLRALPTFMLNVLPKSMQDLRRKILSHPHHWKKPRLTAY